MKRRKRDMSNRAFDRGYQIGVAGRSSDLCPHNNDQQRFNWLAGWREGRDDHMNGLTGISSVNRLRPI